MTLFIIIGCIVLAVVFSILLPDAANGEIRSGNGYKIRRIEERLEKLEDKLGA